MMKLSSVAGAAASGLSSAVVVPIVMLIAVLTAVTGLVLGIGRWKVKHGYMTRFNDRMRAEDKKSRTETRPSRSSIASVSHDA